RSSVSSPPRRREEHVVQGRPRVRWVALAVALDVALALADALIGGGVRFTSAYLVAPLLLAVVEGPRVVAWVGALSVALALVSGVWNDNFGSVDHLLRTLVVVIGSCLAVLAAASRRSA